MSDCEKLKQYFTPKNIAQIIVDNINIDNFENIIDLSVGEGELLKACRSKWNNSWLIGFDIDKNVLRKFKGEVNANIELINGDSLDENTYLKSKKFNKVILKGGFDLCIGNPPFDAYYKVNIKGKKVTIPIEYIFLKKYISICKRDGYVVIILPNGILTNKSTQYIRKEIVDEMQVCKIIGLPNDIFFNAYAKTEVLILKKKISDKNKYKIEFINITSNNKIEKLEIRNLEKNELINRMDCEYYINKHKLKSNILKKVDLMPMMDLVKEHNRGATIYGEKRYFVRNGLKYLHTTNITDIGINYSKKELFIEENSIMDKKRAHTRIGDIIVARVGNKCAGRVAIINSEDDIGVASDCIYIFRMKNINPYYFVIVMKTNFIKNRLDLIKHGSCATVISKEDLLKIEIPIVSEETQNYIGYKYKEILDRYNGNDTEEIKSEMNILIDSMDKILREEDNDEVSS
ncbi:N-6 DNA methylase [Clostridium botulinum]|uniref:N-6 DNA methylase n=1 Tax=Clostridium botulinum TaxID=1491 RepID=UPI001C9B0FFD|nr:N-6 DNA methylase [Clostridium botulinum]MBY6790528.1 N-6 DNA methylase [Clostridium botulinum]